MNYKKINIWLTWNVFVNILWSCLKKMLPKRIIIYLFADQQKNNQIQIPAHQKADSVYLCVLLILRLLTLQGRCEGIWNEAVECKDIPLQLNQPERSIFSHDVGKRP